MRLAEELPQLRVNVPPAVHIKLGHILAPVVGEDLKILLRNVAFCGESFDAHLTFNDFYTPVGRISLKEKA